MTHPRYSVLNLFDPLNATPRRDVTTPDSLSGSDKENAEPSYESYYDSDNLTMTAFFNRTYKTQNKNYSPVVLKTRLVDVGDVTMADEVVDLLTDLTIEDDLDNASLVNEHMDLDEQDLLATPRSSPQRQARNAAHAPTSLSSPQTPAPHCLRTPLADISLDATPVPRNIAKLSLAPHEIPDSGVECYSSPTTVIRATQVHATLAPAGSPLASVINAINLTEQINSLKEVNRSIPSEVIVAEEASLGSSTAQLSPSPAVALLMHTELPESVQPSSIVSSHKYQTHLSHPQDTLVAPVARPRPRARAHTTSSPGFDSHRASVDLHSSFNMQIQCPEASFDLLNDKISFFGGDTLIDTDDFDMQAEEEIMEALAKRLTDGASKPEDVTHAPQLGTNQTPRLLSPVIIANTSPAAMRPIPRRSSLSPGMKLLSPSPRQPMITMPQEVVSESLKVPAPVSPAVGAVSPALTPPKPSQTFIAPVPPAPLRIVKRPKAHDKATSVSSLGSHSARSSISAEGQVTQVAPSVPMHKPVLTGVRRPPPGLMPAPLKAKPVTEEGPRPALSVKGKLTSVLGLRTKATEPPRSPLEACTSTLPTQMEVSETVRPRILKPTASSLSRASSMKMPAASNTTAASKGTRPPSRFGTATMASGLPRPTGGVLPSSRLPVPTSVPNFKLSSTSGSSSMAGKSVAIRRV